MHRKWIDRLGLAGAIFLALIGVLIVLSVGKSTPRTTEWIVLHYREPQNTPSETVTAWDAYNAAPQHADTAAEAIAQFQRDSGLRGRFVALPLGAWLDAQK